MIIDRIEGELAVVETDEGFVDVPLSSIRGRARDGAVLVSQENGSYAVQEDLTEQRADEAQRRFESLFTRKQE